MRVLAVCCMYGAFVRAASGITFWVSGECVECLVGARGSGCVYVACVMYVVLEARVCLQHMGVLHHSVGSRCGVEVIVYVCSCVSFFMGVWDTCVCAVIWGNHIFVVVFSSKVSICCGVICTHRMYSPHNPFCSKADSF